MNSYNIFDIEHPSTILYHAIAEDKVQVVELANEAGYDVDGLAVELERQNVRDQLGRPFEPAIYDAIIH